MKKIYFASDMHLGARYIIDGRAHEKRIVEWLDHIAPDAEELYLLGDTFDYWFEYRTVVPRGFVRFLGKLAQLADSGVKIHVFTGNHDVWMFRYLQDEIGVTVHQRQTEATLRGQRFVLGHGDDLGFDRFYHVMLWCFHNPFLQWCYKWLHPDVAGWIADTWSFNSRMSHFKKSRKKDDRPLDQEWQVRYARQRVADGCDAQYFVFGHRHKIIDTQVGPQGQRLLVIGDWLHHFSYAVFDGQQIEIKRWAAYDGVPESAT